MSQIKKHSFEAVSLLTAANGMLEATIIPAMNQPDWIVPSSLILDSVDYNEDHSDAAQSSSEESVETYAWQQQSVAVFHLLAKDQVPDKVVILEGNTAQERLALYTKGELRRIEVSISEVQDSELPTEYAEDSVMDKSAEAKDGEVSEESITSYLFQAIVIEETAYIVPDLDKIAHQLVTVSQ
ncbi:hypothetical protein ACS8E3_04640 [Psychrobacter sp. 2Y5]|uniref:hypothetical protein n=1 Tax=unclassified Psychrobacter TaxID=196806 RepID=UPI003F457C00